MKKGKHILFLVIPLALATLAAGYLVRYCAALNQIRQSQQITTKAGWSETGSTSTLSILPLYEAWSKDNHLQGGPGLAYLIKTDSATILFDLGNNPDQTEPGPLMQNMASLGITFDDIDAVVISHNHPDHVGGLAWWRRRSFAADSGQQTFRNIPVYLPESMKHPEADTLIVTQPVLIAPGIVSMGTLPYIEPFPIGILDVMGREQVLAIRVEGQGVVLVSGCGHPGLEAIVSRAEIMLDEPVIGIIGGLHYQKSDDTDLAPHIEFLRQRDPVLIALSPHDSSGSVLQSFAAAFPNAYRYIVTGHEITLP